MKYHTICHILVLGIILPLLVMLTTTPANAAGVIALSPEEGEIGDRFDMVEVYNSSLNLYEQQETSDRHNSSYAYTEVPQPS